MLPLQATRLLMLPFIHPLHLTRLLPLLLRATRPLPPPLLLWHIKLLLQQQVYSVSSTPQVTNTDCQIHSNYVPTKIMLTYSAPIAIHTKNDDRDYSAPERQASSMYTLQVQSPYNPREPAAPAAAPGYSVPAATSTYSALSTGRTSHTIWGPKRARIRRKLGVGSPDI